MTGALADTAAELAGLWPALAAALERDTRCARICGVRGAT